MDLSIIIVSWRVKELLEACLFSIVQQNFNFNYEVLVVDNNSGDGTVEMVRHNFPQVNLIASQVNLGFAKANNLALAQSRGKFLLLLNPDTKLIDDSLKDALELMKQKPEIGVLGAKLLNYNLTVQPSVRRFPTLADHLLMLFKLHHLFPLKRYLALDFDYAKTQAVDQVMGAFFLFSRSLMEQIGKLDEKYYIWFEEVDYCRRAKAAGFKVVYFPQTKIIHYSGASFKQVWNFKRQLIFSRSRLRYLRKHQSLVAYLLILLLTPVSWLLSLIFHKNV
ncbi:MAG: glycosyltransferase family 2 protein [Candidatus Komeilibacteria bacterium]|nr:glycosyltransferase family 2 protein [Candidatus Komeilibacteria bacterium]